MVRGSGGEGGDCGQRFYFCNYVQAWYWQGGIGFGKWKGVGGGEEGGTRGGLGDNGGGQISK